MKLDKCAVPDTAVLSVNGSCITLPCSMYAGYEQHCTDRKTRKLVDGSGAVVRAGKIKGRIPKLLPVANDFELNFKKSTGSIIRQVLTSKKKLRKKY